MVAKPKAKFRAFALGTLLIAVIGVPVLLWVWKAREPRHDGKSLSHWLKVFRDTRQQDSSGAGLYGQYARAHGALLKLGTNAAPHVAKGLHGKTTPFQTWYQKTYFQLTSGFGVPGVLTGNAKRRGFWIKVLPAPRDRLLVRDRSHRLLMEMGPNARTATPQLIRLLESDDGTISYAASVLGSIGSQAEPAAPALVQALHHPNSNIRDESAIVLGKIGRAPDLAVPALLKAMRDDRISVFTAVRSLHKLGYQAREAAPYLIDRLRETLDLSDGSSIGGICESLGCIGEHAEDAVPLLIRALAVKEPRAKAKAAFALGQIGPRASAAVSALTERLREEWWYVRENAALALAAIGEDSRPAIAALTPLLEDENQDVRAAARRALQRIGGDEKNGSRIH